MASDHSRLFVFSTCLSRRTALFLWLMLLVRVAAQSRNHSDEVQILMNFKASYEAEGSVRLNQPTGYWGSWNATEENACAWVGVSCTSNFTVEQLDLSGWGLSTLSGLRYLSSLPDLRDLDLSSNNLGSADYPLANETASFTGLTRLDLSSNSLWPSIPLDITLCRGLRYLFLEKNFLYEFPDLSIFENLEVLSIANNPLTSNIPTVLGEVSSLVSLDLSGCQLQGYIPSLSKLTNLLELKLDNNQLLGFEDPELPLPMSLRRLTITGSQLQGEIPHGLASMLRLEVLNMSNNQLRGEIPAGLGQQVNHSFWLDLSQNFFTGQIPVDLLQPAAPGQVASLNLSHNSLQGSIPIPIDGGQERFLFDVLDLSYNQLSGSIPFIYSNASTKISSLWFQNNSLSGDIVDFLARGVQSGFHNTTDLRLQNNLFTGNLARMANIWSKMPDLQVLDVSNNDLQMSTSTAIPDPLRTTLEILANFSMRDFRIGGNDFSGISLPTEYHPTEYYPYRANSLFEVLDFSRCHLHGGISGEVFKRSLFPNLQILNLSNNELTGPIVGSIFNLSELRALDVSNNRLSGPLPMIPAYLGYLANPSLFAGNTLCGYPLPPCSSSALQWWVYLIIVLCIIIALGSCLAAIWRWRVYRIRHEQDVDLIKTLMERESATIMSLRELKNATDNFSEKTKIGEGGFGTIYKGKLNDGTIVAIKRSKREGSEKDKEQFLNEVRILSQVNHRSLVKLLGCCMENKVALLVLEFISNGTLQEHLRGQINGGETCLSWKRRLKIAVQTADALNYLHSATTFPIYHRDVKSANILLTDDLDAKVADFGISRLAPVEATHVSTRGIEGTMGYIDPEYYTSYQLTSRSDVYSFGMVLLELISAKPPIDLKRDEDETSLVGFANPLVKSGDLQRFIDPTLTETYSDPSMRDSMLKVGKLAMECLDIRSKARPSMYEVWMELRNLWLELDDTPKYLSSIQENQDGNFQQDDILISKSFSRDSTRLDLSSIDEANLNQTSQFSLYSELELTASQSGDLR